MALLDSTIADNNMTRERIIIATKLGFAILAIFSEAMNFSLRDDHLIWNAFWY